MSAEFLVTQPTDMAAIEFAVALVREGQAFRIAGRVCQPHKIASQAIPSQHSQAFAVARG